MNRYHRLILTLASFMLLSCTYFDDDLTEKQISRTYMQSAEDLEILLDSENLNNQNILNYIETYYHPMILDSYREEVNNGVAIGKYLDSCGLLSSQSCINEIETMSFYDYELDKNHACLIVSGFEDSSTKISNAITFVSLNDQWLVANINFDIAFDGIELPITKCSFK